MNRKVTIGNAHTWHLLATRHNDGTVTTLCSKTHWRETPAAYGTALL